MGPSLSSQARRWGKRAISAVLPSTDALPPEPTDESPRAAAYRRALAGVDPLRTVVVVADAAALETALDDVPLEVFAGATGRILVVGDDAGELPTDLPYQAELVHPPERAHRILTSLGPVDVVVEHGPLAKTSKRQLFRWLFGHVRPGGLYLVEQADRAYDTAHDDVEGENIVQLLLRLAQLDLAPTAFPGASKVDRALASTIDGVRVADGLVAVGRRRGVSVKVRHDELEKVLRRRPDRSWAQVRREVAAHEVTSTALASGNHEQARRRLYPTTFTVPRLLVREYADVVARPGQVLVRDELVLPDTFRLWKAKTQRHHKLTETGHYFVLTPTDREPPGRLDGQYYYADSEYPRHFGHFMTETLGRLWAWPEAKERNPQLKLLMSAVLPFQQELLAAYGIERDDIVTFDRPVSVESLVSAVPAYHIAGYVDPELMAQTYARLRAGIPHVASPTGERVFLTRERGLWRECLNAEVVEQLFAERGYAVLRPELLTIPEQAAVFREARVVGGFLGSQLYGQIFHAGPLDLVGFVNLSYTSNNEYLQATVLGHALHQFWCPERAGTRAKDITGRPLTTMHTDYVFDVAADRDALVALLERLR